MNRELLEKPFAPEQIKQREGNFGTLDYIEGHAIIQRLNDAFDARWSFEILEHEIQKDTDEVIMLGKLSAGDAVKTQFGSSRITRARETGEMISLADDLKAAATDSLKKAATLLGVGLHLYSNDGSSPRRQQHSTNNQSPGSNTNSNYGRNNNQRGGNGGNGSRGNNSQGNGRISSKQHKFLVKLYLERGMSKQELNDHCLKAFGVSVDYLSRADASSLIENLLSP
jgi:hypothetical protein